MSITTRARRSRSTVLTAATLGALLATGAVVSAPAAFAADVPPAVTAPATTAPSATATEAPAAKAPDAPAAKTAKAANGAAKPELTVNPPASIGHGGQAVEFTETVTNPGTAEASFTLKLDASAPGALGTGRIGIDYRAADGTWKPVALTFASPHFTGEISGVTVAAGATKTVQLRIAAPLHNDWGNGDSPVTLSSAVLDPAARTVLAESTKEFTARALTVQVKDAPTSMVAGGAPAEFDVTFTNASASRYTDVDKVVVADGRSTLQVRKADGSWENITGEASSQPGSKQVTYHLTEDKTLAPGGSDTRHVRFAFTADAPLGKAYLNPWAVQHIPGYMDAARGPQFAEIDLTAAPVAAKPELTVNAPASIGHGGQAVEFTETVTNPGTAEAPFTLKLDASNGFARSKDRIAIEYRAGDGTWKPVTLAFSQGNGFHFTGEITDLAVGAGATRTIHLRIATPLNNDWGGSDSPIKLSSAVLDPTSKTVLAESTKEIVAKALTVQVKDAPTTAVAGGAPAEFDVTFTNDSGSRYTDVDKVVEADSRSTLQVRKADGSWESITGVASGSDRVTYHLTADKTIAPESKDTRHVRLAFTADAPLGKSYVHPWAVQQTPGFAPAVRGPQNVEIELTAAPAATGTTTGTTVRNAGFSTTTTGGTTTGTTSVAGGELAHTGSDGMEKAATGAGALLLAGIGALFASRRRRSA
ncbi:LPXTG cell wall anchor domain-containing protein [Kitasatospora sp. A2-31]|uniref:LPXTG cell wall anchor domain-containing protein n=1 Tax=Kitasatospora sp. A2-31 TaxID=2916414 RepID=UPI001EEAB5FA|nr:LPXTG cell wall anchor domain-containing protein [Kitasatospora sp. A2-31]MCG6497315.1 LPXTG cell wall anchor domain-containing protein [Kitasatospora sp. A2-31]